MQITSYDAYEVSSNSVDECRFQTIISYYLNRVLV